MADCRIVNQSVLTAKDNLDAYATEYRTAGETFETSFNAAIAEMEGATKDALVELFNKTYKEFVTTSIPEMITGLASLLESNRSQFDEVDSSLAASISGES